MRNSMLRLNGMLAAVAFAVAIVFSAGAEAQDGAALETALSSALPAGVTIETATDAQLADALDAVQTANPGLTMAGIAAAIAGNNPAIAGRVAAGAVAAAPGQAFQIALAVSSAPGVNAGGVRAAMIAAVPEQAPQIVAGSTAAQGQEDTGGGGSNGSSTGSNQNSGGTGSDGTTGNNQNNDGGETGGSNA